MNSSTGWTEQLTQLMSITQQQLPLTLKIIGLLWAIQIVNALFGYRLNILGIWPRKIYGLLGIIFAPFLHGNANHLFFNSIPLVILVDLMLSICGVHGFFVFTAVIAGVSGLMTWLLGRPGIHVGASGVLMGYWGFLLTLSLLHPSVMTVIVAGLCLYYLGSLFLHLFPSGPQVSFEGHVFGCLAGVLCAVFLLGVM